MPREREPAIYAGQVALGGGAALRESGEGVSGVAEHKLETITEKRVHYLRRCAHVRVLACKFFELVGECAPKKKLKK